MLLINIHYLSSLLLIIYNSLYIILIKLSNVLTFNSIIFTLFGPVGGILVPEATRKLSPRNTIQIKINNKNIKKIISRNTF